MSRLSDAWEAWLDSSGDDESDEAIREELEAALTETIADHSIELDE